VSAGRSVTGQRSVTGHRSFLTKPVGSASASSGSIRREARAVPDFKYEMARLYGMGSWFAGTTRSVAGAVSFNPTASSPSRTAEGSVFTCRRQGCWS